MKRYRWLIATSVVLILASALLHWVHYLIFRDWRQAAFYLMGDIAFVPLEVLLVVVVIERMLSVHERRRLLQKLNMVIGTFFTEIGTQLLGRLTPALTEKDVIRGRLSVSAKWTPRDYRDAIKWAEGFGYAVDLGAVNLDELRRSLVEKEGFLMALLANPNLLEHERFTDLLWAVEHLMEELAARRSLENLPDTDRHHLAGDIRRVYGLLTVEWLFYCRHLQSAYPYIFSIVVRTHPLQEHPDAVVRKG